MTVVIRCVETGKDVPTGIGMDRESFETATLENNRVSCPHCGKMHVWSRENARLVS